MSKWKSFDFGPETSVDERKSPRKKRKNLNSTSVVKLRELPNNNLEKNNFDFHKQIEPKSVADLTVHAKKVQELAGWLNTVLELKEKKKTQFLLLSGPTGSGKASTLQVLCQSMNVQITDWVNPVDIDFELFKGPGQVTKFLEFFSESKYSSLFSRGNTKKVLLVKEFPNALVRNPEEFFNVLEEVSFKATHPVVFICTDSSSIESNLQRSLFPEDILLKYAITHFSFNSCAPTLLKKGLKRAVDILQRNPELFVTPSPSTIDAILASSMGDIRCAMNQLYLACVIGNRDLPIVKSNPEKFGSKRKRNDQSGTIKHMVRDETLGLFHGLGRVLNPKRCVEGDSWRINCNIQKLVDEFSIQPSMFTSFLFENYLKYFGDLDDVKRASEVLSVSAGLLHNWDSHDSLVIALWISVLGLMVFNEHKTSKWNQIKGPKKLNQIRVIEEPRMDPTDRFYYNLITKTEKYHKFKCGL